MVNTDYLYDHTFFDKYFSKDHLFYHFWRENLYKLITKTQ